MSLLSSTDRDSFLSALRTAGLQAHSEKGLESGGKIQRYRIEGDKSGSLNGWYVLFVDGSLSAGAFGDWKTGESHQWCSKSEHTLSPQERELWRRKQQEAKLAREAELKVVRQQASEKATYLEGIAQLAAVRGGDVTKGATHPYLLAKGVKPYGVKILKKMLLVPLRNAAGVITSVQFIQEDGSKRFMTGGEVAGSYFSIGQHPSVLCVCEGFATGASIFEATGFRVAVAFNAGNLVAVAKVMRDKFPEFTLIICADNDVKKEVNTGLIKAAEAAEQIHGMLAVAKFQESDLIKGKFPTDFNDLHRLHGLSAVREVLEGVLAAPEQHLKMAKPEAKSAKQTLNDFELLIEESDDFDFLTDELLGRLAVSELPPPALHHLMAKIGKKANVPKHSLLDVLSAYRNGGSAKKLGDYEDRIDELNLSHALLPIGGRMVVMNHGFDPETGRKLFTFSAKADFELRYCNRKVFNKGEEVGLGTFWMNHPRRAEFDGMVFSPGLDRPGYLNLWTGWGAEPKAGSCQLYLDFVLDVLCSGDGDLFDYIIRWSAHLVQCPQELPETALVFRGAEGIGKNTFVDPLSDIVGREHFLTLTSMGQITGRFSGHMATSLLVFCNESVWGGDKSAQGVLKSMITDNLQPIEFKGRDLVMVKSYRRMIFATNETWAVPRGEGDRRYVVTDVSDKRKGDYAYFKAIRDEMSAGGTEALFDYLLNVDISQWHPRSIPGKLQLCGWELKIQSGGSIVQWWFDMLQQGWLKTARYAEDDVWPPMLLVTELQAAYLAWCMSYKITHPECSVVVGKKLKEWGIHKCRPRQDNQSRQAFYQLPNLEQSQFHFSTRFSIPPEVFESVEPVAVHSGHGLG